MTVRPGVEVVSLTDVGCQRENNEDSFRYWEPEDDTAFARLGRLAVIADGMGGTEGGQFASHIAVESVQELYSSSTEADPQTQLVNGLHLANSRVLEKARREPALHGMGTTLTAIAIVGNPFSLTHISDRRLYLIRTGSIRALTRDHSLVARLVESGVIRAQEADTHPQRHVLTAAVGVTDAIEPDVPSEPLQLVKNDVLLLCTDGLWGQMSESEIAQTISSHNIEDATRALVQLAKDHGGPDNITLQILRVV